MTTAEILEAAKLIGGLSSLRASLAEVDFPDKEISARGMTVTVKIEQLKNGASWNRDTLLSFSGHSDPEITAAVLTIIRRRRREKLSAALRRLEQLGVRS